MNREAEFAYEHLGKYLKPGSDPWAWINIYGRPFKDGVIDETTKLSRFNGVVRITEKKVTFFKFKPDISDIPHIEVRPTINAGEIDFNPPPGASMCIQKEKANITPSGIVLNTDSRRKNTVCKKGGAITETFYPDSMAEIAGILNGMLSKEFGAGLLLFEKRMSGQIASPQDQKKFDELRKDGRVIKTVRYAINRGIPMDHIGRYLRTMENDHA